MALDNLVKYREILLICLGADNIDGFVELNALIASQKEFLVVSEHVIVRNTFEALFYAFTMLLKPVGEGGLAQARQTQRHDKDSSG